MIFIVDDNIDILETYEDFFDLYYSKDDLPCQYFSDPKKALAEITNSSPKVLVTDYNMDGLSGAELANAAKKINPDIKVILVSENSYMIESHFEVSPFDVLFGKLSDPKILFEKIEELLIN